MKGQQENRIFKTSPLPFQGQKRNFAEQFKNVLTEFKTEYHISTVIDLFGGSGLLSHITKRVFPEMRVIYNDYDDFHKRLAVVQTTNLLLKDIREYLTDTPKGQKIDVADKSFILNLIRHIESEKQQVDYITLSSSLLFSGKFAKNYKELESSTFYNSVKHSDYSVKGYLDGLEVVREDYIDLFNLFKSQQDVLFIVDPPYLSTDTTTYNSDKYWKLKDYLNVLNVLNIGRYIYFTSNKSSIIELCDWFSENYELDNPFNKAKVKTYDVTINPTSKYTDMMLYKYNN